MKARLDFYFFFFLLVGGALGSGDVAPSARITLQSTDPVPHIFRTITDKVNHEVVLTLPTTPNQVYLFHCNATFPVTWNYFGEGAPSTSADVGRQFKDFYNVNTYTYQATLFLHQLEELQSGRYVCRGIQQEQERLQVHYDLFVPGNGTQMLISNADKKVFVGESKMLTSLPCEVTDPSLRINLYKGDEWGGYHKVEMNESIAFRPRIGFILKMNELPNPFGTYMCLTPDKRGRRKVHLIPEQLKSKYDESWATNAMKSPLHISYDHEYNRMVCCSGNAVTPKLQWASCSSVLDCKIKSVCFEGDRCEESGRRWVDPGPVPKGCAATALTDGRDHGIFRCSTQGGNIQYQPYLLNRGHIFTDFESAPPSEAILTLSKTSAEVGTYVGSEVEYLCNSTRFYFAYGIRWAFRRGNDDIDFMDDSSTYVVKDKFSQTSHRRQTTFRILHPDIKAIICFVPIANSPTEWRTVSLPINIRESSHTLSPHYPYPTHSSSLDHISNRIPYSPEPYSTNRPKILSYPHNTGEVDPTPNVDIGDILDKKPHPPMIQIDSLSSNSHMMERDYLYGGNPPRGNVLFTSTTPPPPPPQPQYSHQYRGSEQPDIITLDNIHHFNPHIPPVHSDIHEANMRHRQRFQMSKTTTTRTTTPPPPPPTPFYDHPKYSHDFHHQNQHQPQVPEHFPEREREQWQDYGPVKHNKEYKVSSQFNFNTKHKGYVESAGDKYLLTYTTTPTPPRFSPDQENREEAPHYNQHHHHHQQQQQRPAPMIHYDSKEKQYGLKDNINKWKTMKVPAPYDEHISSSSSYYQATPPSPPQYWDERKKGGGGSVVLEPDVPVKLDSSIPYAPNDYYISSLIAKHREKPSEEESKAPTPLYPDASLEHIKSSESMLHHRHHEEPPRPPPLRYGEKQDGWERVHTQMGASNHYNEQSNLRRSGYHSVSGEFVELAA